MEKGRSDHCPFTAATVCPTGFLIQLTVFRAVYVCKSVVLHLWCLAGRFNELLNSTFFSLCHQKLACLLVSASLRMLLGRLSTEASWRLYPYNFWENWRLLKNGERECENIGCYQRIYRPQRGEGRRKSPRLRMWHSQGNHSRATPEGKMWWESPKALLMFITSSNRPWKSYAPNYGRMLALNLLEGHF